MADVFLSYVRTDSAVAERLLKALNTEGISVWRDVTDLVPGEQWAEQIEHAISAVPIVLVLWSRRSVVSGFVAAEASFAADRGVLLPVLIEAGVEPPPPFNRIQYADLTTWATGTNGENELVMLIGAIRRMLEETRTGGRGRRDARRRADPHSGQQKDTGRPPPQAPLPDPDTRSTRIARNDVFVAYSRKNNTARLELVEALQSQQLTVFSDVKISGGGRWRQEIAEQIEDCDVVLVLLSSESLASTEVGREVDYAAERNRPIIPIRLERVTPQGALGMVLNQKNFVDAFLDRALGFAEAAVEARKIVADAAFRRRGISAAAVSGTTEGQAPTGMKARSARVPLVFVLSVVSTSGAALLLATLERSPAELIAGTALVFGLVATPIAAGTVLMLRS